MVTQVCKKLLICYGITFVIFCHLSLLACFSENVVAKHPDILCPKFSEEVMTIYKFSVSKLPPEYLQSFFMQVKDEFLNLLIFFGYLALIADLMLLSYYIFLVPCGLMMNGIYFFLKVIAVIGLLGAIFQGGGILRFLQGFAEKNLIPAVDTNTVWNTGKFIYEIVEELFNKLRNQAAA